MRLRYRVSLLLLLAASAPSPAEPQPAAARFGFAVLGDNRGDDSGVQPAVFGEILAAIDRDGAALVFNTGDMVYGYTEDEAVLREYWRGYREAVRGLTAPLYHVPGNHDLFDAQSARVYRELWGRTYFTFDHGNARFIALDTESQPNRLGETQLRWLESQLDGARGRHLFVFLHRPLFPVDGHTGNSLDRYPEERDRLHRLFARHRVRGVFLGHEHLFHHHERDGVPYYITGGAGANLYVPPELGGYHHYLRVEVDGERVEIRVEKAGAAPDPPPATRVVEPGSLLDGWESPLLWYTWDHSIPRMVTREHASEGTRGLKVHLDLSRVETPLLYAPLSPARDLSGVRELAVDILVPEGAAGLAVTAVVKAGEEKVSAPARPLTPGWNRVAVALDPGWLPPRVRRAADQIEWMFSGADRRFRGWVVFDDFRTVPGAAGGLRLAEGWESDLAWGAWDLGTPEVSGGLATQGEQGLKVHLSFPERPHPVLYASLQPRWDLRRVRRIAADVYVPGGLGEGLSARLVLVHGLREHEAPAVPLRAGWNRVVADLDGAWLSAAARGGAEQVRLAFLADGRTVEGWVVVDNLRAERE